MKTCDTHTVFSVPAEARERILDTAWELMNRHGYRAVTMSDLAKRLGMSKATLYAHFADKEALVRALHDRVSRRIQADVRAAQARAGGDVERQLVGSFQAVGMFLSEIQPVLLDDVQRHLPDVWEAITAERTRHLLLLEDLIRTGQRQGALRPVPPRIAVLAFVAAVEALMRSDVLRTERMSVQDVFEGVVGVFLHGLVKR